MLHDLVEATNALVRPVTTFALVAAFIWGFYMGKIGDEAFLSVASMVFGFWYATRTAEKNGANGANGNGAPKPPQG